MIGFFDSGLGGLTILHEVAKCRPGSYLYLGDNARAPYGLRSVDEVRRFTLEGVAWLVEQNCRLIILACNTASANALRFLQQAWLPNYAPQVRVLGILVPTVEAITGVGWHEPEQGSHEPVIAVFATPSTVASGAYEREIIKRLPRANIILQACPDLVSLIETTAPREVLKQTVQHYVDAALSRMPTLPDTVLLGCTHYALIENLFRASLPSSVSILSQPSIVAQALQTYLKRHADILATKTASPSLRFATTGDPDAVALASQRFFSERIVYERVMLHD